MVKPLLTMSQHCEEHCSSPLPWGAKYCHSDVRKLLNYLQIQLHVSPIRGVHWSGSGEDRKLSLWLTHGTYLTFLLRVIKWCQNWTRNSGCIFQHMAGVLVSNATQHFSEALDSTFFRLETIVQDRAEVAKFRFACRCISWHLKTTIICLYKWQEHNLNIVVWYCFIACLASSLKNQYVELDFQRFCATLHEYRTGGTAFPFNA